MPRRRSLEERLAELNELRADPTSDAAIEKLREALSSKLNHLVAEAARIVGEFEVEQLQPDLAHAFDRFMENPARADPLCLAKTAIAEALWRMGSHREELFLQGIHHVQLEASYGGKEDAAAKLRVACALGLVRTSYPRVMVELAHLLADQETDARIGAARAVASLPSGAAEPLLRFKALVGDEDTQVMYECFGALLTVAADASLPFVGGFLQHEDPALGKAAALALGESRLSGAFDLLKTDWQEGFDPDLRRTELLAIAMLRHERAMDFLLSLIADAPPTHARDAIAALEMYRRDQELWERVERLIEAREDVDLS